MAWLTPQMMIGALFVYAYGLSSAVINNYTKTIAHNDVKNCQFCQVCEVGPSAKGPCMTVQSGEAIKLDSKQLGLYGYYVACPIGLSRASDAERTVLEGLLKSDDQHQETISLNEHLNSVAKVHMITDVDDPAEVLRVVNPKFPDSDS